MYSIPLKNILTLQESSPASTELEAIVTDWLAQMLKLPEYFLNSHSGPGAGMIQVGTAIKYF